MLPDIIKSLSGKKTVGLRLGDSTLFHNLTRYEAGTPGYTTKEQAADSYSFAAYSFYHELADASELFKDECIEGRGYFKGFKDGIGEIADPETGLVSRLNEYFQHLVTETSEEAIHQSSEEYIKEFDGLVKNVELLISRIEVSKRYFRKHIRESNLNPRTISNLRSAVSFADQVIATYKEGITIINQTLDIVKEINTGIEKKTLYKE